MNSQDAMKRNRYIMKLMIAQLKEDIADQPVTEFKFHPIRKWRLDICYPPIKMGIEIHGGNWESGRHNRGSGFKKDREKMNEAQNLGFKVFEFLTDDVESGFAAHCCSRYYKKLISC